MTLKDFAEEHGISAIARRHFGYAKPVTDDELGGYAVRGALTYLRALDTRLLGLTHQEAHKAFEQGRQLVALDITPALILTGIDQRNLDGGKATAEGIVDGGGMGPRVYTSPAVTYPHYADFEMTRRALAQFEDYAVHRCLAGKRPVLWSEPPEVFKARIMTAIMADYGVNPVLFDLNFEQITLLYFLLVKGLELNAIPYEDGAWMPTMGGGVVLSGDRNLAKEFTPDLEIVE